MISIAHRGASGYEPENTLKAFKRAISLRADMIELDVRICRTGELVVIHDARVDRMTNGHGKVSKLSLYELKRLNIRKGEKIPTLEEVLTLVKNKIKLNINIKDDRALIPTLNLLEKNMKKHKISPSELVVSALPLGSLRTAYQIKTVTVVPLLFIFPKLFLRWLSKKDLYAVGVYKRVVSKQLVDIVHSLGMQIYVWTVNEREEILQMKTWGVDGVITDYPDRVN